jgi:hypothetical protein
MAPVAEELLPGAFDIVIRGFGFRLFRSGAIVDSSMYQASLDLRTLCHVAAPRQPGVFWGTNLKNDREAISKRAGDRINFIVEPLGGLWDWR